jgi:hypothetical protein
MRRARVRLGQLVVDATAEATEAEEGTVAARVLTEAVNAESICALTIAKRNR